MAEVRDPEEALVLVLDELARAGVLVGRAESDELFDMLTAGLENVDASEYGTHVDQLVGQLLGPLRAARAMRLVAQTDAPPPDPSACFRRALRGICPSWPWCP